VFTDLSKTRFTGLLPLQALQMFRLGKVDQIMSGYLSDLYLKNSLLLKKIEKNNFESLSQFSA